MTIYLTGDTHGMYDDPERFDVWNFPEGDELTRDDTLIVLGDFGLPTDPFANDRALRELNERPWTTCFVDGNHECYPYFADLDPEEWNGGLVQRYPAFPNIIHLMRGEVYDLERHSLFVMGGARSIDRYAQEANGTWFPEEMPDELEYRNALENLEERDWRVDFVLTHTCASRMLEDAIGNNGLPGLGVLTDELTDFLDELEDRLDYGHWFCGHFHHDTELDDEHAVLYQSIVSIEDYD